MNSVYFPLVSIIIPTYNNVHTIYHTLESCFNQTYTNIEIIVIDDGSTDDTKTILEPYIQKKQITYIYKINGRAASARNVGLAYAKGEFIQFLDADDILLPEKISIQIEYLLRYSDISGVYCDYFIIKQNKTLHYKSPKPIGNLYDFILDSAFILPIHAPLIRNKNLTQFNELLQQNEDRAFWLDYFTNTDCTFAYIDIPLVHYCLHETNTSYNGIENIQNMLKLLHSLPYTAIIQNSIIEHHGLLGFIFLETNHPIEARLELKRGLHTSNLRRKLFFFVLYILTYSQTAYRFIRWNAAKIRSFYKRKEIQ
jgi:glycosyltransferase involved in cell wall biosynthesis